MDNYNTQLRTILDTLAPAKSRRIKQRSDSPWYYNHDITKTVNKLVYEAKRTYFVGLIDDCGTDSKRLFTVSNQLAT